MGDKYLLQAYGEAGVVKIIRILEREIVSGMKLLGASSIQDLVPEMVGSVVVQYRRQDRADLSPGRAHRLAAGITYVS